MRANVIEKDRGQCLSQTAHENPIHSHASGLVRGRHTHMLTRHTLPSPPHKINPFALSIPATLHADFDSFLSSFFFNSMCTTIIFFTLPKERAMGRKAPLLSPRFIFCPRQNRFAGTSVVQLQLKGDGDQIPLIHNKTTL